MRAVAYIFLNPTSAFTFAPLVARNGGTPCWIPFSSAVPGFALPNRFRVVRDLCVVGGGGSIVRAVAYIFPDPTSGVRGPDTLWRVPWTPLLGIYFVVHLFQKQSAAGFAMGEGLAIEE